MTTFSDRNKKFENKFAHNEELNFKANARRNNLLGLWAAEKLGISGDEAKAYATEVKLADFEEVGDQDVLNKISKDFKDKGVDISDADLRIEMDRLLNTAREQILNES